MSIFLRGLLIGFSIAAPVGPIGVLVIRRTLANGRLSGFLSGLGAATADAAYGCVAALGLTVISSFLVKQQDWLRLFGGLFLVYLGLRTFLEKPASADQIQVNPVAFPATSTGSSKAGFSTRPLLADYASTFLLTLTNPMTILSFVAIFAGLGLGETGGSPPAALLLVLGVFCGSALWWLILSGGADLLRARFLRQQGLRWVNRISGVIITAFGLLALGSLLSGLLDGAGTSLPTQRIIRAAPADTSGFNRAEGPRPFNFPADHGSHPDFQTEWWYYTGNLATADGRRFGYQLTFFRRALRPVMDLPPRESDWASGQVYMAHFALSDIGADGYHAFERLERGAAGLSGAQAAPFQVWLDDWQVNEIAGAACASSRATPCAYQLTAAQDGLRLDLTLTDLKGLVLQGDRGYSRKGPEPGQASYYYSLTHLESQGSVQAGGQTYVVSGLSWMDHEFSTSALSAGQVGWDWFSLHLDDGSELMVFQLRRSDGSVDPFSAGTLIAPDGAATSLGRDDFQIEVLDTWKSLHSRATYPAAWRVRIPSASLDLNIRPYMADQELNVSYAYWEGAVGVSGTRQGAALSGDGYVELTGYSASMGGEF